MPRVKEKSVDLRTRSTKDKILLTAARLFAVNGYEHVSMREIAQGVNVRPSTIYFHYKDKEEILNNIYDKTSEMLDGYFDCLEQDNKKAQTIDEVVKNMFVELREVYALFIYYGVSTAQGRFISDQGARKLYLDLFLSQSTERIASMLHEAIERELTKPFHIEVVARLIMTCVATGNGLRIAEAEGVISGFDFTEAYDDISDFLLAAVKAGL